jgi:hypothetical protein
MPCLSAGKPRGPAACWGSVGSLASPCTQLTQRSHTTQHQQPNKCILQVSAKHEPLTCCIISSACSRPVSCS